MVETTAPPAEARARTRGASRLSGAMRSLVVIAVTAVAMFTAELLVSYIVVLAVFGGGIIMLLCIPLVGAGLAASIAALSRALTGRLNVLGAIAVTVLFATVGVFGVLSGILAPLPTQPDASLHWLLCALCALTFGLFLGPWPLRIAGAAAVVGVVVFLALLPTSQELAAAQNAQVQSEIRQEQIDHFLTAGTFPVVTGLAGWSSPKILPTGSSAVTWMLSDSGSIAQVAVISNAEESADGNLCYMISVLGEEVPARTGTLPEWCKMVDGRWKRVDGAGFAFYDGGRTIVVVPADITVAGLGGATTPASAAELAALVTSLRTMTEAEVKEHILPVYQGVDTPVINVPGL